MVQELFLVADFCCLVHLNNKRMKNKELNSYQLMLGYKDNLLYKKPIIVDMEVTPHLLVCGLSGQGKSRMIENAIKDKKVILINAFNKDFKNINGRRINGNKKILDFFEDLLENLEEQKEPLYLVTDELLVLCMDKKITQCITDLLAIGRHYNIFLIGISQIGTKESVKFKDLFNARVCFRQVEESSYRAVLGSSPEDTKLLKRQFYLYSTDVYKGYTYNI